MSSRSLKKALAQATSYEEWKAAARALDERTGVDRWKLIEQSERYDYVSIRVRLDELRAMRARQDNRGLLFTLHEGIHGNMGGMGRQSLYDKTLFGTKKLITDYVDEIVSALEYLADPKTDDISFEEKLDFFRRADHCFGRSAFMMSGSGSLFYFHIGVVRALCREGLMPNVLSGSSGGAFVGALLSTHAKSELDGLLDPVRLVEQMEELTGHYRSRSAIRPRLMRIDEITRIIEAMIPDMTFDEAYKLTGRELNISIAPAEKHQKSRLLNAITSPNVFIREAVLASAAVPGVYPPVTLAARNHLGEKQAYLPSRKWVDGSVSDDMPAKRLARLYGVNHYIVSQTNPHVVPFMADGKKRDDTLSQIKDAYVTTARAWMNASASAVEKPLSYSPTLTRWSTVALSVLNQDYIGDINILPENRIFNPFKVLAYLSKEELLELVSAGEKATWPRMEMIRIQTRISRKLASILADYDEEHVQHVKAALRRRAS
jgi:TAG lipase/steryl ester hydrolase/phospholipase A2/LPA acyltransferase